MRRACPGFDRAALGGVWFVHREGGTDTKPDFLQGTESPQGFAKLGRSRGNFQAAAQKHDTPVGAF